MAFLDELESLTARLPPRAAPSPASPRFKICGFHNGLLAGGDSSLDAAGTSAVELFFLTSSSFLGGLVAGTRGGSSLAGGALADTSVVSRIALDSTKSAALEALEGGAFAGGAFAAPVGSKPGGAALTSTTSLACATSAPLKPGGGGLASGGPTLIGATRGGALLASGTALPTAKPGGAALAFARDGASPAGGGLTAGGLLLSDGMSKTGGAAGGGGCPGGSEFGRGSASTSPFSSVLSLASSSFLDSSSQFSTICGGPAPHAEGFSGLSPLEASFDFLFIVARGSLGSCAAMRHLAASSRLPLRHSCDSDGTLTRPSR
mmetsp:Transcript_27812/g.43380  ORF Transcript_27812/g.43380 Transcript_27812/m.43380 type:complete len:319 (+) Transcript_27812:885-1841(+)